MLPSDANVYKIHIKLIEFKLLSHEFKKILNFIETTTRAIIPPLWKILVYIQNSNFSLCLFPVLDLGKKPSWSAWRGWDHICTTCVSAFKVRIHKTSASYSTGAANRDVHAFDYKFAEHNFHKNFNLNTKTPTKLLIP